MNTKNIYKKLFLFLFLFAMVMVPARFAKADTIVLRDGRMYTEHDVTGDRRADMFSISMGNYQGYGGYKAVVVRVNGKNQGFHSIESALMHLGKLTKTIKSEENENDTN